MGVEKTGVPGKRHKNENNCLFNNSLHMSQWLVSITRATCHDGGLHTCGSFRMLVFTYNLYNQWKSPLRLSQIPVHDDMYVYLRGCSYFLMQLLKQAIVTCEASYWNKSLWHVKRVIETNHCDKWSELLKQAIATGELQKQLSQIPVHDDMYVYLRGCSYFLMQYFMFQ
jgi:hypothetical protein